MKYDNYIIRTKDYVGIFKFKSTFNFLEQERIKLRYFIPPCWFKCKKIPIKWRLVHSQFRFKKASLSLKFGSLGCWILWIKKNDSR